MVLKHPFWLITWLRVALIALVPSCIIFTQALRAGSSNCVLDGSLDGDVSFTNFMNEYHVLNVAQCVINSSNSCGYPSCLLSLHVNTFHGMFVVC